MLRVLVLEDDLLLAQTLQEELEDSSYDVTLAYSIDDASKVTYENKFDLYLFDVNLPDGNGFEFLKALRDCGDDTPAIFLTSKSTSKDVGLGFEIGANDYVKKPFDMEELLYRVKRFLKIENIIKISSNITLNKQTYEITVDNKITNIQKKEMNILIYFVTYPNKIITKDEIINSIFNGEYFSDTTFRVYITNIKKIIGSNMIKNIRGSGYIFEKI